MSIDATTFKDLYQRYWTRVYSICYRYTGSREDAREMTQDVFLSLWRRRNELQFTGPIENYLSKSARYQVLNYHRSRSVRAGFLNEMSPAEEDHSTEQTILARELQHDVQQYADQLPRQSRKVFELKKTDRYSNRDIAEALEISEKAVNYHLGYIRRVFKIRLSVFLIVFFGTHLANLWS